MKNHHSLFISSLIHSFKYLGHQTPDILLRNRLTRNGSCPHETQSRGKGITANKYKTNHNDQSVEKAMREYNKGHTAVGEMRKGESVSGKILQPKWSLNWDLNKWSVGHEGITCAKPVVERNIAYLSNYTKTCLWTRSCKISRAIVDCGLYEKPLVSFKWKRHNQMYIIKLHFIHTVRVDSGKTAGNRQENWWWLRPRDDNIKRNN